ncbi:MAG: MarR family winged helix-turn-helix transcriptional regulator [Beijerinckiaceae bacterium]|nr:MarR family winged helix-turn-helix transcriptional regulator [Beijerinckiaceae bacterium]
MPQTTSSTCSCSALRQASRHVTRLYDEALAPTGLGLNQYAILANLQRLGPSTIQALAKHLVMDRSTLGHLLRPLETRGLLSITSGAGDRRVRRVELTAAGSTLMEQARPLWARAQRHFENVYGAANAAGLRAALAQVVAADLSWPGGSTVPIENPVAGHGQP